MKSLIFCNTGSDSISKVNIEENSVITLPIILGEKPIGPHGVCTTEKLIYTANCYNDTVSVINKNLLGEIDYFYVGPNPTDIEYLDNKLYIACGEGNNVIVYNLEKERIDYDIATGCWPHNLCVIKKEKLLVTSNLQDSTLSIIDCVDNKVIKTINAKEYPTSVKYSKSDNCIYVCESYLGSNEDGYIEVFSTKNYNSLGRVKVGKGPMNLDIDDKNIYVSNINDGTINIVDKETLNVTKTISIGGMPRCIYKVNNKIFIQDYIHDIIWMLDGYYMYKKAIAIGK